jgi:hypothetical protein
MQTTTAPSPSVDRICSWVDELQRVVEKLPSLSPGARRAVGSTIVSFVREDVRNVREPRAAA